MTKQYKGSALAALHESMQGLHDIGLVDTTTMRKFYDSPQKENEGSALENGKLKCNSNKTTGPCREKPALGHRPPRS